MVLYMVLRMARPQKHRKTGIYWFRIRVPDDVQRFVRRTEITRTLETRDPVEAIARRRRVSAEVAAQWDNYRNGVQELSQKQTLALAGLLYREMIAANEKNPGRAVDWQAKLESDILAKAPDEAARSPHGSLRPGRLRFPRSARHPAFHNIRS